MRNPHSLEILTLARQDPRRAWPAVVQYVQEHPATEESIEMVEALVYADGDAVIDQIEAQARVSEEFRETVASAYVGGIGGDAADRFFRLIEESQRSDRDEARR